MILTHPLVLNLGDVIGSGGSLQGQAGAMAFPNFTIYIILCPYRQQIFSGCSG